MGYRWKPNASQRRAFAEKMKDPDEKKAYEDRKRFKNSYTGFKDKSFVPTTMQMEHALTMVFDMTLHQKQRQAADIVFSHYSLREKCHNVYIHIVNAHQRGEKFDPESIDNNINSIL